MHLLVTVSWAKLFPVYAAAAGSFPRGVWGKEKVERGGAFGREGIWGGE